MNKGDGFYLGNIIRIIEPYATPGLKENLETLRRDFMPRLEGRYEGVRLSSDETPGSNISLTSWNILDTLVNGSIFHSDQKRRPEREFLESSKPYIYLWLVFGEIINPTMSMCIWVFKALRWDGILEDVDYPMHCQQPRPDDASRE
jgi:hypothetical protein